MIIKNKKGLTIVELTITIAIMALVMPLVTQVFLYGMKDYISGTKYLMQQTDLNSFFMNYRHDFEMGRDLYFFPFGTGEQVQGSAPPPNLLKAVVVRYDPTSPEVKIKNPDPTQLAEEKFCRRYEFKEIGEIEDTAIDPATGLPKKVRFGELRVAYISSLNHLETPPESAYTTLLRNVDLTRSGSELMSGIFYSSTQKKAWFKISLVKLSLLDETADSKRTIDKPILLYFDYPNKNTDFS